jgi:hypothetical protein
MGVRERVEFDKERRQRGLRGLGGTPDAAVIPLIRIAMVLPKNERRGRCPSQDYRGRRR